MVADLIENNPIQWKRELIFQNFGEDEATAIYNIPLSRYNQEDKMIWRASRTGEFSVRSAYHLEKERQERKKGESSNGARPLDVWKKIWGLKIPDTTKLFLWRACNKILPTKDNLKKRKVLEDDTCIFCCEATETTHHILWDCPSSQDVWCVSCSRLQKRISGGDDFCEMLEVLP
jgi:hypothetical protein